MVFDYFFGNRNKKNRANKANPTGFKNLSGLTKNRAISDSVFLI